MRRARKRHHRRRMTEHRALLAKMKDAPCADCGGRFPSCVMDFDHRDPATKIKSVANLLAKPWSVVMDEIAKCDLVCANCHRIRTSERKQWLRDEAVSPQLELIA